MYEGTVTDIKKPFLPGQYKFRSCGNYVTVRSVINGQTVFLKYNHMDGVNSSLVVGSTIAQGAYIGITGVTEMLLSRGLFRMFIYEPKMLVDSPLIRCHSSRRNLI